ncbi:copper transporter [Aeromicrobium panaciterrae]|uniref:copper transporter n=1 Tax=Aeromicrobium panaciterrae TaxID=363861 RepID=UPI0031CE3A51
MINFRYHLVSIAAILLALAAGIALGSGPLDDAGDSLGGTDNPTSAVADPAVASFESAYASRTSQSLFSDSLKGQSVVVITMPGASAAEAKSVITLLGQAEAEVTGQVELTSKLLSPTNRQFAEGVAQQAGAGVAGVTAAGDSYGRIGAALGRSILSTKTAPLDPTATTIQSAYVEGDLITLTKTPSKLATLAVIITGPKAAGSADQGTVVAAMAGALDSAGKGVVVAGPATSSTDGGIVKAVRDSDASSTVSTVDVTDVAAGRVVTVLALAKEAAGQSGSWGTSRSSDGGLPN